jgi:poly-gamma-glutamate synthesis protein (capsule biosynthesis protein)
MSSAPTHFPYAHSGEPGLPRYLQVRAEGLPLRQALWSAIPYVRKYLSAKFTAPAEEVRYFDEQRRLLRLLAAEPAAPGAVRLGMVGDMMWLRSGWSSFVSPEVLDYLNGFDVVLGNLESPIARSFRVPALLPDYFTYNSPPELVTSFRRPDGRNTFTALTTCNNHSLDRGDQGLRETLEFLDGEHVLHAGVRQRREDRPFITWETKGIRFGLYAACWGLNNPALEGKSAFHLEVLHGLVPHVRHPVDLSRVTEALAGMSAEGVDVKVVYLHWGYEFEHYPCPDLMQVGREIVRAGADVLMGSHPHVLQPLEVCFVNGAEAPYRDRWGPLPALSPGTGCVLEDGTGVPRKALIVYSLGNFVTAMFNAYCQAGMVVGLDWARDERTGRVDWHRPEVRLTFMEQRHPRTRSRRLVLLDEYLRELAPERARRLRPVHDWLHRHLWGEGPPATPGTTA